eukprot:scaffold766_cov185-Chaetoceros_neogracile.AAC.3
MASFLSVSGRDPLFKSHNFRNAKFSFSSFLSLKQVPEECGRHNCKGIVKRCGKSDGDYESKLHTDGSYLLGMFTNLLIDMVARTAKAECDLYAGTISTADEKKIIRCLKVNYYLCPKDGLIRHQVHLRTNDTKNDEHTSIGVHRLQVIVADAYEIGTRHHAGSLRYLGQDEDGKQKLLDDVYGYTSQSNRKRQKTCETLATQSDADHLVGRKDLWMNGHLFVMPTSHSLNRSRSEVRIQAKCWCFMTSKLEYKGGN